MRDLAILAIHLLVTVAKLLLPGGARSILSESLLLKHQLLILVWPSLSSVGTALPRKSGRSVRVVEKCSWTPKWERDARGKWLLRRRWINLVSAGWLPALHLFLAGLPRSENGDHQMDAHYKIIKVSPHRSRASRCRFGVELVFRDWRLVDTPRC